MPKANAKSSSIRRIAIDGHFLDETQTRLHSEEGSKSLSYLSAPVERHEAIEDWEGVTLRLPALTALQLFFDGVLTTDVRKSVKITGAGRLLGTYYLHWMHTLPGHDFGGQVLLRFSTKPAKKQSLPAGNAWLKAIVPLKLYPQGDWDPAKEYWGNPDQPIEAWAATILRRGPRPMYEMEQVLPAADTEDDDVDPLVEAHDLKDSEQVARARKLLEGLLIKDIRCLYAHAHLGNIAFDRDARTALEHYRRGVLIGELSLGERFDGVLSWSMIDNRPFLRCLSGLGLCLWRLDEFEEAEALFERLLWMSPSDNLGIRFLLPSVHARKLWSVDGR